MSDEFWILNIPRYRHLRFGERIGVVDTQQKVSL